MDGYTKLHAKLLTSSIWNEPNHVRILWITLLAMADHDGAFEGSPSGIAALARLTPDEVIDGLAVLEAPSPLSSDGTTGERIRRVCPGVWEIINHAKYREKKTRKQIMDLERQRRRRATAKESDATRSDVTPRHADSRAPVYVCTSEGAEGSVLKKQKKQKSSVPQKPDEVPQQVWDDFLALRKAKKAPASQTALAGLRREASKAGLSLSEVLEIVVQNGWQGFKADWMTKARGSAGSETDKRLQALKSPKDMWERFKDYDGPVVEDI